MRKRIIIIAALLVAGGAIVNVAAAWIVPTISTDSGGWHFPFGWPATAIHRDFGKWSLAWHGFATNTLIYSAIVGVTLAMSFGLWRQRVQERRIKHGLCPKCAYPIGTSEVCTECGANVRTKRHRSRARDV